MGTTYRWANIRAYSKLDVMSRRRSPDLSGGIACSNRSIITTHLQSPLVPRTAAITRSISNIEHVRAV